jgi:hypothetical protein
MNNLETHIRKMQTKIDEYI